MFREIRTNFRNISKERIDLERFSKDFRINIAIDFSKNPESVGSGLKFVDSILKNTNFNVEISKEGLENRELIENVGFAFGEGLRKLHEKRRAKSSASLIRSDKKMTCMFAVNARKQLGEANIQIINRLVFITSCYLRLRSQFPILSISRLVYCYRPDYFAKNKQKGRQIKWTVCQNNGVTR